MKWITDKTQFLFSKIVKIWPWVVFFILGFLFLVILNPSEELLDKLSLPFDKLKPWLFLGALILTIVTTALKDFSNDDKNDPNDN